MFVNYLFYGSINVILLSSTLNISLLESVYFSPGKNGRTLANTLTHYTGVYKSLVERLNC